MSVIAWIIILVVLFLVLGFVLRMLEGIARIILSVLVFGVLIAGGVWFMMDVNEFQTRFASEEKLFVLDIDGKPVAAFRLGASGQPEIVSDLREMRQSYPNLFAIQGTAYKVVVLTWPVVASDLEVQGFKATAKEVRAALLSTDPKQLFIDKGVERFGARALGQITQQADELYPTQDAFASTLFALLAQKPLSNPQILISGHRQGTVTIYPETVTFKILKVLPEGLTGWLLPQQAA
jgi:hypothetical protein